IAPGAAEGEFLMVESKQRQDRGMQIVNVNFVLGGLESELIGRTMHVTTLDAAPSHPHGEPIMVVIPAIDLAGIGTGRGQFHRWSAAEFTAPNNQGRFE